MNRLTREEAAKYIGCSMSKLYSMERGGLLEGTYYQIGRRRLYITDRLEKWMNDGGELNAYEKKLEREDRLKI